MKQIIYNAMWCSCIYESGYSTISLHKTKEGAEEAIKQHKMYRLKYFQDIYEDDEDIDLEVKSSIAMEAWMIDENELLD